MCQSSCESIIAERHCRKRRAGVSNRANNSQNARSRPTETRRGPDRENPGFTEIVLVCARMKFSAASPTLIWPSWRFANPTIFPNGGRACTGQPLAGTLPPRRLRGRRHPLKLHVVGIDLGKPVFHLVGLDPTGKVVIRKKCSPTLRLAFPANLQWRWMMFNNPLKTVGP
jgi:hypothetical protein